MRSIGKKNSNLLKGIVLEEWKKDSNYSSLEERVVDRLPLSLWDIWEGADSEIRRMIWDASQEL